MWTCIACWVLGNVAWSPFSSFNKRLKETSLDFQKDIFRVKLVKIVGLFCPGFKQTTAPAAAHVLV
jgi:hypothetical protein